MFFWFVLIFSGRGFCAKAWLSRPVVELESLMLGDTAEPKELVSSQDVEGDASNAWEVFADFYSDTFIVRCSLEYAGRFCGRGQQQKLRENATDALKRLQSVLARQKHRLEAIEIYEGDDWETAYGSTGLWRRAKAEIEGTQRLIERVRFYKDLSNEAVDKRNTTVAKFYRNFFVRQDARYDLDHYLGRDAAVAAIIFDEQLTRAGFENLISELLVYSDGNFGISIRAAIGCIKKGFDGTARNLLASDKRIKDTAVIVVGGAVRFLYEQEQLAKMQETRRFNDLEYELVTEAIANGWVDYGDGFSRKLAELYQQGAKVLIAAGKAAERAGDDEAVIYYAEAVRASLESEEGQINAETKDAALKASRLVASMYRRGNISFKRAHNIIELYMSLAKEQADDKIVFTLAIMLSENGFDDKAIELFESIADKNEGELASPAQMMALITKAGKGRLDEQQMALLKKEVMCESAGQAGLLDSYASDLALTAYCGQRMRYGTKDGGKYRNDGANEVIDLLSGRRVDGHQAALLAEAHLLAGQWQKACESLSQNIEVCGQKQLWVFIDVLDSACRNYDRNGRIINHISPNQVEPNEILDCMKKLVDFCQNDLELGALSALSRNFFVYSILTEARLICNIAKKDDLDRFSEQIEELLERAENNIIQRRALLRCGGRVEQAIGNYSRAARIWSELTTQIDRNAEPDCWWRSKYYQFYCLKKCGGEKSSIAKHGAEVAINSFEDIPLEWCQKLADLTK
jgi:hypothetical protein